MLFAKINRGLHAGTYPIDSAFSFVVAAKGCYTFLQVSNEERMADPPPAAYRRAFRR